MRTILDSSLGSGTIAAIRTVGTLDVPAGQTWRVAGTITLSSLTSNAGTIQVEVRSGGMGNVDAFAIAKSTSLATGSVDSLMVIPLGPWNLPGGISYSINVKSTVADTGVSTNLLLHLLETVKLPPMRVTLDSTSTEPEIPIRIFNPDGSPKTDLVMIGEETQEVGAVIRLEVVDESNNPVGGVPEGGTFKIVAGGYTTPALNYTLDQNNIDAIIAAVEALPSVGAGNFYAYVDSPVIVVMIGDIALSTTDETLWGYDGEENPVSYHIVGNQTQEYVPYDNGVTIEGNLCINVAVGDASSYNYQFVGNSGIYGDRLGAFNWPEDQNSVILLEPDKDYYPGLYLLRVHPSLLPLALEHGNEAIVIEVFDSNSNPGSGLNYEASTVVQLLTAGTDAAAVQAACEDAIDAKTLPATTATAVRSELATELGRIDTTITSRHASGAAVAKSPATLDWSADVSNKPTIGTSTLTSGDVTTACGTALATTEAGLVSIYADTHTTIPNLIGQIGISIDPQDVRDALALALGEGVEVVSGSIDAYLAATIASLSTGEILVRSNVNLDGTRIELIRGDQATITWTEETLGDWPEEIDTAVFSLRDKNDELEIDSVEVIMDELEDGRRTATLTLSSTDTEGLTRGHNDHPFDVEFRLPLVGTATEPEKKTCILGLATVYQDVTR